MKAVEAAVVSLYETGATIDQISDAEGLDRAIVITILTARCPSFSAAPAPGPLDPVDKIISDTEYEMMFEAYKNLQYDENSVVREKVLKNCINLKLKVTDGLGRDDPKKVAKLMAQEIGKHANVLVLNGMLKRMREKRQIENNGHAELSAPVDVEVEVSNG